MREISRHTRQDCINKSVDKWLVAAVIALQLCFGIYYSNSVPFLAPSDERAHFDNVMFVATHAKLHVLQYLDNNFEAVQPPLYYFIAAVLVKFLSLFSLRKFALVFALRILGVLLFGAASLLFYSYVENTVARAQRFAPCVILYYQPS